MTERYDLILACYRSGQMNERQWVEHLKDEHFAAWAKRKKTNIDASVERSHGPSHS